MVDIDYEKRDFTAAEFELVKDRFSPDIHDFHWNADFSAVRVCPLRWWDDQSYIAYQSEDGGEEGVITTYDRAHSGCCFEPLPPPAPSSPYLRVIVPQEPDEDDDIPF